MPNNRQPRRTAANLTETDFADDRMGKNQLQGNDQERVRNQRHAVPGASEEAEDVVESFRNSDPKQPDARKRQE